MTEHSNATKQPESLSDQIPQVKLLVDSKSMPYFTTMLQYGIELETPVGTELGAFLNTLPGLSKDYLAKTVQTIFHNGTAVDNLEQPLGGEHPVVALSAAMPGLAGAIFRRNGPHSTLRTTTTTEATGAPEQGLLQVKLKLFNQIARDKGEELLQRGVVIGCAPLINFLEKREDLLPAIVFATFDSVPVAATQLGRLLGKYQYIKLQISTGITQST